ACKADGKTWMPGTRPSMTVNSSARGVLKRHCAIGKTPLRAATCAIALDPAILRPAGVSLARTQPPHALCASRAADPYSVAGAHDLPRHRPLRLCAGAAGHARPAGLVLFHRGFHEHDQRGGV